MNKDTLYVKRKRPTDMLLLAAIYVSATLAVALLLGIILYVFVKGIRAVKRGEIRKQAKSLKSSRLWTAGKQVTTE